MRLQKSKVPPQNIGTDAVESTKRLLLFADFGASGALDADRQHRREADGEMDLGQNAREGVRGEVPVQLAMGRTILPYSKGKGKGALLDLAVSAVLSCFERIGFGSVATSGDVPATGGHADISQEHPLFVHAEPVHVNSFIFQLHQGFLC